MEQASLLERQTMHQQARIIESDLKQSISGSLLPFQFRLIDGGLYYADARRRLPLKCCCCDDCRVHGGPHASLIPIKLTTVELSVLFTPSVAWADCPACTALSLELGMPCG